MRALLAALISAALAALAGYGLGRAGLRRGGLLVVALLAAATAWIVVTARDAPGMEGLARFVLALLFLAPATLGMGLGLWWGLRRRRGA